MIGEIPTHGLWCAVCEDEPQLQPAFESERGYLGRMCAEANHPLTYAEYEARNSEAA